MKAYLLRRRKLGRTSCREIVRLSKTGIQVFRNDSVLPAQAEICIRWGCTSDVPQKKVFNGAAAIHLANDKVAFRKILQEKELCPQTWFNIDDVKMSLDGVIVRPRHHHQGRKLYYCKTMGETLAAWARCGPNGYITTYIPKVSEFRVFCAQGRAICVARKIPADPKAIAWNVYQGGKFENVQWGDWPLKAVKIALEGFALSGLDFGGVDIMVDANGECYILELNSAPSLTSPYRQQCFAKVLDYMVQNGKEKIPLVQEKGGYLKFIHPAIEPKAKVA